MPGATVNVPLALKQQCVSLTESRRRRGARETFCSARRRSGGGDAPVPSYSRAPGATPPPGRAASTCGHRSACPQRWRRRLRHARAATRAIGSRCSRLPAVGSASTRSSSPEFDESLEVEELLPPPSFRQPPSEPPAEAFAHLSLSRVRPSAPTGRPPAPLIVIRARRRARRSATPGRAPRERQAPAGAGGARAAARSAPRRATRPLKPSRRRALVCRLGRRRARARCRRRRDPRRRPASASAARHGVDGERGVPRGERV